MKVYMAVTADNIELPLYVADNCKDLARHIGRPYSHVKTILSRGTITQDGIKLVRVEITDSETED